MCRTHPAAVLVLAWLAAAGLGCGDETNGNDGGDGGGDADADGDGDGRDDGDTTDAEEITPGPGGWIVFREVRDMAALPMSDNLLANGDFEAGDGTTFTGWSSYEDGFTVETSTVHGGTRAVRLASAAETESRGVYQTVTLDQTEARPIYLAGWNRTEGITGEADNDFSVYLDIRYVDGTPLYGQTLRFEPGTHDWTFGETIIVPDQPIASISFYVLLRRTHAGTAWFDDLQLREVQRDVFTFDDRLVYVEPMSPWPFEGSATVPLPAAPIELDLSAAGGAILAARASGTDLSPADSGFKSGFFVRDAAADSDFVHFGGTVTADATGAVHAASDDGLGLELSAAFASGTDALSVDVTLRNLRAGDRALTLYFALPLDLAGWSWGDDVRTSRPIGGGAEFRNTVDVGFGANDRMSWYPFAAVSGPAAGIGMGYPLERPAQVRFAANPHAGLLYAAIDVALSPATAEPGTAHLGLVLFRHEPTWGFRAAADAYYDLFPDAFAKRVDREGPWVAFSPLDPVAGLADFGIAFHELGGSSQIAFDDTAGVLSFRYLTEPWSYWMEMPAGVPNDDEARVMETLRGQLTAPEEWIRNYAEATMSSCTHDETGRCRFEPAAEPWCPYGAVFTLDPDPDIADPEYPLNKGNLAWNDDARAIYTDAAVGTQDGEYLDSLEAKASLLDYRATHLAASDLPLVYDASFRPAVPEIWATYEFARWVADEIHGMGKLMMANGALLSYAFPAHLFDVMGNERNWLWSGTFQPDPDERFNFWRTMSYRKPFCTLMNTDFSVFDHAMVERYFKIELFYGVYPSFFSHNASEDRYWDDPVLVDRDRDLFVKYIPLIRGLGAAGWEPVTFATTSDPDVYVERWGSGATLHFTVRNMAAEARSYELAIDAVAAGLTAGVAATFDEPISGTTFTATPSGSDLLISDTIASEDVRLFRVVP
jgi:hypothetical protein